MYALIGLIAITFVAAIVEVFFNIPTIQRVRGWLNRLFIGCGYLRFFALTAVFAGITYGIGELIMAPFLGLYTAGTEVGTMFLVIFLGGMVRAIFSGFKNAAQFGGLLLTGKDRRTNSEFSIFSSTMFVTGVWGSVFLMAFFQHGVSGPLISVRVF